MPDRILRDELWQSDRFLDLPTDIARLAFIRFLSLADDFGNFEGGLRRIARLLLACTQAKNDEAVSQAIDAMMTCDLIRRYSVDGRELFHIPRFKSHRQYLARRFPMSPWCDDSAQLGKTRRVINQGLAKDVVTTLLPRSRHVAEGVGVGVGVGGKEDSAAVASRRSPPPAFIGDENIESIPARAVVQLDPNWSLPQAWGEDAEKLGWTGGRILKEAERFRQYWVSGKGQGKRRTLKGWRQSWSNWLRKAEAMA